MIIAHTVLTSIGLSFSEVCIMYDYSRVWQAKLHWPAPPQISPNGDLAPKCPHKARTRPRTRSRTRYFSGQACFWKFATSSPKLWGRGVDTRAGGVSAIIIHYTVPLRTIIHRSEYRVGYNHTLYIPLRTIIQ